MAEGRGELGRAAAVTAGHDGIPGVVVPNPAYAAVPGWAEYASSATVTGPSAGPAACSRRSRCDRWIVTLARLSGQPKLIRGAY